MDSKIKHLEFIQGVVNRLSTNSFLLKGWSVVLVSALFALSATDRNHDFVLLAFFPALVFWGLDGYFLWQERLFRALYDHVRGLQDDQIDFSMNIQPVQDKVASWSMVTASKTLLTFHGVLVGAIMVVAVVGA